MSLLAQEEIQKSLSDLPGWEQDGQFLRKEFVFPTFTDAMVFVNEVAQAAEDMGHHPDIAIHHNTVKLATTTYDLMGITEKDIELATRAQETEKMIFGDLSKT
ncbi:4a-hydroxytetrahydrobiopterin dehydratase [Candidatus Uhrbacteria bacterium]|nr:4a-hydroxytetrahydrobiopterin dehydratase [Candidatus Uhrbacteria bacterium]